MISPSERSIGLYRAGISGFSTRQDAELEGYESRSDAFAQSSDLRTLAALDLDSVGHLKSYAAFVTIWRRLKAACLVFFLVASAE